MKNNITELVFILDRSGSMHGLEADTVGGFNSIIEKQRGIEGECYITTVLFDNELSTLHDRVKLGDIAPMKQEDFRVGGCTALLDAVGSTIHHIANIHKYARAEDVPQHTIFVIMTDGMENASHRYTAERVKQMIEHEKQKYDWEFLFLAANIDAVETAANIGISADRAADYRPNPCGSRAAYHSIDAAVMSRRTKGEVAEDWCAAVNADFNRSN